jgi:hypothetical protein
MTSLVDEISDTPSARWYDDSSAAEGPHGIQVWGTRVRHYEQLVGALDSRSGDGRLARTEIARTVATLYNRFRNDAEDGLRNRVPGAFDIAARLNGPDRRWDVVDNVAVEAKLWSYWPYRAGWLDELGGVGDDRRTAAETLVRVVAVWAFQNRRLAAYLGNQPPLAAFEDLCVILPGQVSKESVMGFLGSVVRVALDPRGGVPASVLDTVHEQLMGLGFYRSSYLDELLERAVDAVEEVGYLLPRLGESDRGRIVRELSARINELQRRLDEEDA